MLMIYFAEKGEKAWPSTSTLSRWLERVRLPPKTLQDEVLATMRVFQDLLEDEKHRDVLASASFPECVVAGVYLRKRMRTFSFSQITSAIVNMRANNKSRSTEVKADTKGMNFMLAFLNQPSPKDLPSDGQGDTPALHHTNHKRAMMDLAAHANDAAGPDSPKKRKKVARNLDTSPEDALGPERPKKVAKKRPSIKNAEAAPVAASSTLR